MANTNNTNIQYQQFGQNSMAQFFPQPQGNVYLINSSNEVTLVPVGTVGISAAICMTEGVIYLKAMQNGNPMLLRYKLNSLDAPISPITTEQPPTSNSEDKILNILKNYDERIQGLERIVNNRTQSVQPGPQQVQQSAPAAQPQGGTREWQL